MWLCLTTRPEEVKNSRLPRQDRHHDAEGTAQNIRPCGKVRAGFLSEKVAQENVII